MNILKKVFILFGVCFISDIISHFLPFPFPGSVLAMVLVFLLLFFGILKPSHFEPVSDFLAQNMGLVFVPATVAIVSYVDVLRNIWWQFLLICIVTTVITFAATAYAVKLTIRLIGKAKEAKKNV